MMISSSTSAVINHLLAQEPWAREKLVHHRGKIACLDTGIATLKLEVAADGAVQAASHDVRADVTIRVKLADLPRIAQNRERAFSYVQIEGDADFANTISQLSQALRWDAEHDLSRWMGDIAATRLVAIAKQLMATAKSTQQGFAENAAEYFLEENPMLVCPRAIEDFTAEIARLRDDVERLSKRVEKLEGKH